jgi:hypothetical protein
MYDSTGKLLVDISNTSRKAVQLQVGSSFGSMVGLFLGAPTQMEVPTVVDLGGVYGISFAWQAGNYTGDTGTAPANTNFRFSFL